MKSIFFPVAMIMVITVTGLQSAAQGSREIKGIVTSFKSLPLNNVRVYSVNTKEIKFTDSTGMFIINCMKKDKILVAAAGFGEKRIKIGSKSIYSIDLPFLISDESFQMAVRNRHIKADVLKKMVSTAGVKNVKDYSKYKSVFELIDAEIYEVRLEGTSVYNNKIKSMDSNPRVLYVVDDKIVTDISYINPNYVKSVEFLEDARTTMYGSQGANGVLKIYLK